MELIRLLEHSMPFFLFATGMLGLVIGSFLNVVIHRLPLIMERSCGLEIRSSSASTASPPTSPCSTTGPSRIR